MTCCHFIYYPFRFLITMSLSFHSILCGLSFKSSFTLYFRTTANTSRRISKFLTFIFIKHIPDFEFPTFATISSFVIFYASWCSSHIFYLLLNIQINDGNAQIILIINTQLHSHISNHAKKILEIIKISLAFLVSKNFIYYFGKKVKEFLFCGLFLTLNQ